MHAILLTLLLALTTSPAWASPRSHGGLTRDKPTLKLTKPTQARQKKPRKLRKRPKSHRELRRFFALQNLKRQLGQVGVLRKIIALTPQTKRASLYLRLAELHWQVSQHYSFAGHRYDAYRRKPDWPSKRRLQLQAWSRAKGHLREAAKTYDLLLRRYPHYPRACEVHYFLGKTLTELGQRKRALRVMRTLISRFSTAKKKCPYVPSAYLAFAEHYFLNGQVRTALRTYRQLMHFPHSSAYGYALYKIGWCQYNLARYRKALQSFVKVVHHARRPTVRGSRRLRLLREALRDLVLAYSRSGSHHRAYEQFVEWAGADHGLRMFRRLGQLYVEAGDVRGILFVYRRLLRLQSGAPQTLRYQRILLEALLQRGDHKEIQRGLQRVLRLAARLHARHGRDHGALKKERSALEALLRKLAKSRHYQAQKTRRMEYYRDAASYYKAYMSLFSPYKGPLRFLRAEALFALKRYVQAGVQYRLYLKQNPKAAHTADAAYNAVLSFYHQLKRRKLDRRSASNNSSQATHRPRLPRVVALFLQSSREYLLLYPKAKQAVEVAYKYALLKYQYGRLDEALIAFAQIVKRFPRHRYALYSGHYSLDIYNLRRQWKKLSEHARAYLQQKLGEAKDQKTFHRLMLHGGLKYCQTFAAKAPAKAARCFCRYASLRPAHPGLSATAQHHCSIYYFKARQPEKAIAARRKLLEEFPRSKYEGQSLYALASWYSSRFQIPQAIAFYERYLNQTRAPKKQMFALERLGRFREIQGRRRAALRHYRRLLSLKSFRSGHPKAFVKLYFHAADLHQKAGEGRIFRQMMKRAMRPSQLPFSPAQQLLAQMRLARALESQGQRRRAHRLLKLLLRRFARLPQRSKADAKAAAAHAQFCLAEETFKAFLKIKLPASGTKKALKRRLQQKREKLQMAWRAHGKVVSYKEGRWAVAAWVRAGDISLHFARFLQTAPLPSRQTFRKEAVAALRRLLRSKGVASRYHYRLLRMPKFRALLGKLVANSRRKYRDQLLKASIPYRRSAIGFYQRALRLAHKLLLYSPWAHAAKKKLQRLNPQRYPPLLLSPQLWSMRH